MVSVQMHNKTKVLIYTVHAYIPHYVPLFCCDVLYLMLAVQHSDSVLPVKNL